MPGGPRSGTTGAGKTIWSISFARKKVRGPAVSSFIPAAPLLTVVRIVN